MDRSNHDQNSRASTQKILSIYGYTNYRTYLRDFYRFKKDSYRGYSYRKFSKAAGFNSPNMLKLVIDGHRNLTSTSLPKFIKGLGLVGQMAEYFRVLVKLNQAKTDNEQLEYFEKLKRLTPAAKKRKINAESLRYLSHWLFPVIREMIHLPDFCDDPYWIARRLTGRASIKEINQALQFLIKNNFIVKNNGRYETNDNMVLSSDEVKNLAIRNYHREMLNQARQSLESLPLEEREFGALTFVLPEDSLIELKFKLKEFRKELHLWAIQAADDKKTENVVQLNFQMFPQTKRIKA